MFGLIAGLPFLFLVTGIFNVRGNEVTSSNDEKLVEEFSYCFHVDIYPIDIFNGSNDYAGELYLFTC